MTRDTKLPGLVFISHSVRDVEVADAVKNYLEGNGVQCWKAPECIRPGEEWADVIARVIPESTVMVLLWSSESMRSRQVLNEITLADRSGVSLIPVRLEDIQPEGAFQYYLYKTHWLDALDASWRLKLQPLGERVIALLSSSAAPARPASGREQRSRLGQGRILPILMLSALAVFLVALLPLGRMPWSSSRQVPSTESDRIAVDQAVATIQAVYISLSTKQYARALRFVDGSLHWQFKPDFFSQFDRVTIQDLRVKGQTGSTVNLEGVANFVWPDGRIQKETRTFSVNTSLRPPRITATEFGRVIGQP